MSFLDKVTKAVGDAVDRGKKEVDQFMRIQKINGQIGDIEKKINQLKGQIQEARLKAGEIALDMVRAGTIVSPEIQALHEQITGVEQEIAAEQAAITEKKAEIEKIKVEDRGEKAPAAAAPASSTEQPQAAAPAPAPTGKFCPQCGTPVTGSGAFCGSCGTKLVVTGRGE